MGEERVKARQAKRLIDASAEGRLEEIRRLIGTGVPKNARDAEGETALMAAAREGQADAVTELLGRGVEIDASSASGDTALILAAYGGKSRIVRLLLEGGAALDPRDDDGYSALDYAVGFHHGECAKLLKDAIVKAGGAPQAKRLDEDLVGEEEDIVDLSGPEGEGAPPAPRSQWQALLETQGKMLKALERQNALLEELLWRREDDPEGTGQARARSPRKARGLGS